MALHTTITYEDAERRDVEEFDDANGARSWRTEWKPGSAPFNRAEIARKAAELRDALVFDSKTAGNLSTAQMSARIRRLEAASAYVISLQLELVRDPA